MDTYLFSCFTHERAVTAFGLNREEKDRLFQDWETKAKDYSITDFEKKILQTANTKLVDASDSWNEFELQLKFISKVIELVDFDVKEHHFSSFAERNLEQKINSSIVKGKVDWMVAHGRYEPSQPFFFIHEYKRSLGHVGDPTGQLLAAMYVAQMLNKKPSTITLFNPKPKHYPNLTMYGCYIIGKFWNFVVLKEKDYYISHSYDASRLDGLYEIVRLLKAQKDMIIECVTEGVV